MLNDCKFIGILTHDLEPRSVNGVSVLNFSLGCESNKKGVTKNVQVNFVAFNKTAELIMEKCSRGDKVFIIGEYQNRKKEINGVVQHNHNFLVNGFQNWGYDG